MAIKNAIDTELPIPIADGGTGQTTQQAAVDALTNVAGAGTGHVLTKDGSGNAVFQAPAIGGESFLYQTVTTSDATETSLITVEVPDDSALTFTVQVSAKGPSNKTYWAIIDGGVRKNAAESAVLVGTRQRVSDEENTSGYVADVDVSGSQLRVRVTGASAESVKWEAKILYNSDAAGEDIIASNSILAFTTQTTDATQTTLGSIAIPDNSSVNVWALVTAHYENTGSDKNYWANLNVGVRRNNGGSAALVGTASIIEDDEGTPGYSLDVDVSGNNIRLRVTGASSETVTWSAKVILTSDSLSEQIIDLLPIRDNDTYLQWRNAADSANINAIKINASDALTLYDFWEINASGTLNGLKLSSGDNNTIAVPTTDGSDFARLVLCGAGTSSNARGAAFYAHGNEHPSFPGVAAIQAGASAGIDFYSGGALRWGINSSGDFLPNSDNSYDIGSASLTISRVYTNGVQANGSLNLTLSAPGANEVQLFTNATQRWKVDSSGHLVPNANATYDIGTSHSSRIRDLWTSRHHLTANGQWAQYNVYTTNGSGSSPRLYIEPDSNSITNTAVTVYIGNLSAGNLNVNGSVTKNSGAFVIKHPDPAKNATHKLKHCFVESPTEGDTLYRYTATVATNGGSVVINLPDYFQHLNKDVQVWTQAIGQFANSYAEVNVGLTEVTVHGELAGDYSVLVIGTRKDPDAVDFFSTGVEYLNPVDE
jgi:sarcosine oxidase gamma subunit